MPRYKKSQGRQIFSTCFPEEFSRWINYELHNFQSWNSNICQMNGSPSRPLYITKLKTGKVLWTAQIRADHRVVFASNEPRIWLRKGLTVDMGNGRLIVDAI